MRKTTNYKKFAAGGAVPLSVEVDTPQAHVAADAATEQLMAAAESPQHSVSVDIPSDDASQAFQRQIDELRRAEQVQRQRAAPAIPQTRAERILHWRDQGFSEDQSEYFNQLQENPQLTHQAVMRARQDGLADENSQAFHDKVRANFQLLNGVAPADVRLDMEPSPKATEFFEQPAQQG
jgi:hypothetical protein